MGVLKDVLVENPKIFFVGINPGLRSGALGRHFAGPGNPFWRLLHAAKLTPVLLRPDEDQRLAEFGHALTNICPRCTKTAAELTREEFAKGRREVERKIARHKPEVVAFVGLSVYKACFPDSTSPGPGLKPETMAGAKVFALPSPSGLNANYPGFAAKLVWFEKLRESL